MIGEIGLARFFGSFTIVSAKPIPPACNRCQVSPTATSFFPTRPQDREKHGIAGLNRETDTLPALDQRLAKDRRSPKKSSSLGAGKPACHS